MTYTTNVVTKQEIPENGGITDQKFYCGPEGAAFDYNEFILPYVGVAIMFFSVVYSRYLTNKHSFLLTFTLDQMCLLIWAFIHFLLIFNDLQFRHVSRQCSGARRDWPPAGL